jgi:WD40 repeat protein
MGNCETVTITAESGTFTGACHPESVTVDLSPNTIHYLEVIARVRQIVDDSGCEYGGYTLRTNRDRDGNPLVIQQGQPPQPPAPGAVLSPANASQLENLQTLAPEARLTADFVFRGHDQLLSVGYAPKISVWDLESGQESKAIGEGQEEAEALTVTVSPDLRLIATGGTNRDNAVRLWDLAGDEMRELGQHTSCCVEALAFAPSGRWLASGDANNTIHIWEVESGRIVTSLEGESAEFLEAFHRLAWLDDETLAAGGAAAIYWWDLAEGQLLERIPCPPDAAFFVDVAFDQQGRWIAAAAQDENAYIWDRQAAEWAIWPAQAGDDLRHVEFSPNGELLAATSQGDLLIWDVASQVLLARYPVASGDVAAVRFSPDGRILAAGGWDSPVRVWGIP